jgi:hypothetical protein
MQRWDDAVATSGLHGREGGAATRSRRGGFTVGMVGLHGDDVGLHGRDAGLHGDDVGLHGRDVGLNGRDGSQNRQGIRISAGPRTDD